MAARLRPAGVAQYLLIDALDAEGPAVSVFSDPGAGVYRQTHRWRFGEEIHLGGRLATSIDSVCFPV